MADFPDYHNPDWEAAGLVHDWRNYASDELRGKWGALSWHMRRVVAECLQEIADREDWD